MRRITASGRRDGRRSQPRPPPPLPEPRLGAAAAGSRDARHAWPTQPGDGRRSPGLGGRRGGRGASRSGLDAIQSIRRFEADLSRFGDSVDSKIRRPNVQERPTLRGGVGAGSVSTVASKSSSPSSPSHVPSLTAEILDPKRPGKVSQVQVELWPHLFEARAARSRREIRGYFCISNAYLMHILAYYLHIFCIFAMLKSM